MNSLSNLKKQIPLKDNLEQTADVAFAERYYLFVNNKFVAPKSKQYLNSVNPANNRLITKISCAGKSDVDAAVAAAKKALPAWQKLPASERGKYLLRLARLIQERSKLLAIVESIDGGKPIKESRDFDLPLASQHFFYHAGWADKLQYAFPNQTIAPVGVCGQIIPWNFPLLMAAWKLAPALACGNTVVLKPAESTSLSALFLAEIICDAGLPAGVVNIITGDGNTGHLLANHPDVNKVAFTGSTKVGKLLQQNLAGTGKTLSLELGGKGAHIILEDAAIDQAIESVVQGIFFNQGQVCCAGSRLYVQESVAKVVIAKLKRRLNSLIVGNPLDKNTDIGAINNQKQLDKLTAYLKLAKDEGLEIIANTQSLPENGLYCSPTLIIGAGQSHRLVQEEIFGPLLCVEIFRTIDEAIEKANQSPYGLSAGIWSEKASRSFTMAGKLKAGVVWINGFNQFDPGSAFGGYKESGFGREGGIAGLREYLQIH